jgi:hypothetical protein
VTVETDSDVFCPILSEFCFLTSSTKPKPQNGTMTASLIFNVIVACTISTLVHGFTQSTTIHPGAIETSARIASELNLGGSDDFGVGDGSRRLLIQQAVAAALVFSTTIPPPANADTCSRPYEYAPIEALIPAARVKLLIDRATKLANDMIIAASATDKDAAVSMERLLDKLEALLLVPQNFTQSPLAAAPQRPAKQYLESYQKGLDQLPILAKPGAMLVQSGEIDTWKRLKRQERRREEEDEIRAALNAYTSSLAFDAGKYSLSATQQERSNLIRNEQLPDIKSVIAGDMGMRYLYRNQVLSAMDTVREELRYQRRMIFTDEVDATELRDLLVGAQSEMTQWFSMIDEKEVREALVLAAQQ